MEFVFKMEHLGGRTRDIAVLLHRIHDVPKYLSTAAHAVLLMESMRAWVMQQHRNWLICLECNHSARSRPSETKDFV